MTMMPRCQKCGQIGWCTCSNPFKGVEYINNTESILKPKGEPSLTIPDIRNKLQSIVTMIELFEDGEYEIIKSHLEEVKKSINYLSDREVYKL